VDDKGVARCRETTVDGEKLDDQEEICPCQVGMRPDIDLGRRKLLFSLAAATTASSIIARPALAEQKAPPGAKLYDVPNDATKVPGRGVFSDEGYGTRSQFETEIRLKAANRPFDNTSWTFTPLASMIGGVLGRKVASVEGFNYTPAMKAHAAEDWNFAHLDALIHKPTDFAPGTMMAFPGLPEANQRAEVIAFLRTKADSAYPLP